MTSFQQTKEYKQSAKMIPSCDEIYRGVLNAQEITRAQDTPLDMEYAIDVVVKLPNGSQITGQEKALSYKYMGYKTLTMEFYQNRYTKEKGEFFKIASQFYFSGYTNYSQNGFACWSIINLPNLILWIGENFNLEQLEVRTKPSTSNASFLIIPYSSIPERCYIAKSENHDQLL